MRRELNQWIRGRADALRLAFCDTASLASRRDDPDRLGGSPDGLHPDVDGYRRIGEGLRPLVERELARPR